VPSGKNGKHGIPETVLAEMKVKADTSTKAMQEKMNKMKDEIKEDMNATRKANRETLKEMTEEIMNANQAKTNANLKEVREETKSGQTEIRSIVNA
jgi:DNA anti-recombination protein RmuC